MNWTGAPDEREPLAIRAMMTYGVGRKRYRMCPVTSAGLPPYSRWPEISNENAFRNNDETRTLYVAVDSWLCRLTDTGVRVGRSVYTLASDHRRSHEVQMRALRKIVEHSYVG